MRELIAATKNATPVIALFESSEAHGGLVVADIHGHLKRAEDRFGEWGFDVASTPSAEQLLEHLFKAEPLQWNRIGHFRKRSVALAAPPLACTAEPPHPSRVHC